MKTYRWLFLIAACIGFQATAALADAEFDSDEPAAPGQVSDIDCTMQQGDRREASRQDEVLRQAAGNSQASASEQGI